MGDPHETFAAGRLIARQRAPYFRAFLLGLAPVETQGLGTIGVTEHGVLLWDPEYVRGLTPEQFAGGLIHEVLHLVGEHAKRARRAGRDRKTDNMAGDLAINPAVIDMGFQLPPNVLFPDQYGWERGLTTDEYYEKLREKQQESSGGDGDDEHKDGAGGHFGAGKCGSCGGNPLPNEPDDKSDAARSEAEMDRMSRSTAEAVREHIASKGAGHVPGMLARWAEDLLKPPKVHWRTKLARLTRANVVAYCAGDTEHYYGKPSRRAAGLGYGPGCPVLPATRTPVPEVGIVGDTSASMGTAEMSAIASETDGIVKACGGTAHFMACDAAVNAESKIRSWRDLVGLLKGGGGTDFTPAIERAATKRIKVLVFITDGQGPAPVQAPRGMRIIWVLTGPYAVIPYRNDGKGHIEYGDVIKLDADDIKEAEGAV